MMESKHSRKVFVSFLLAMFVPFYSIYWQYVLIKNTKLLQKDKTSGKKELLLTIFVPFYSIYWWISRSMLVRNEFKKQGLGNFNNGLFICMMIFSPISIISMALMQRAFNKVPAKQIIYKLPLSQNLVAWICLSPALVLLIIFTVWPIINTLIMAFSEGYNSMMVVGGATFNFGIGNFINVIQYKDFITCLVNTMLLTFLTVPISTILALLISVCLNAIKPLQRLLQTIYFLPYVTNSIAIGMVFAAMFNMVGTAFGGVNEQIWSFGIINSFLGIFGLEPINWINSGSDYWANIAVMVIYIVWNALPFKILILLGGLQSINKQYYDAARVDGTRKARVLTKITVPLLSPMLAYVVITGFIGGFKEYSSIVGIFGEDMGPAGDPGRLNTMVGFIYDSLATQQGRASAAALILFVIIFIVTMINLGVSKKKTHY